MFFESFEGNLSHQGQFAKGFGDPPWWSLSLRFFSSWANSTSSVLPVTMFSCKHRKISAGLLMSFLWQYCTVFWITSSTVIYHHLNWLLIVWWAVKFHWWRQPKHLQNWMPKKLKHHWGAEVMLLLCCDSDRGVAVTSGCVRVGVAEPETISSWLLVVLNADCIKAFSSSSYSRDPSWQSHKSFWSSQIRICLWQT